jgi:hypothetical protein
MPADRNMLGKRGEAIATTILTRSHGRDPALFEPVFLGEKRPTIDLMVELIGAGGDITPYFFAQVKLTSLPLVGKGGRLPIRVRARQMQALWRYPAPTYVIGIKDPEEQGFIFAAVTGGVTALSSMPTTYPLALPQTLQDLYDEVRHYWQSGSTVFSQSRFT